MKRICPHGALYSIDICPDRAHTVLNSTATEPQAQTWLAPLEINMPTPTPETDSTRDWPELIGAFFLGAMFALSVIGNSLVTL